MSHYSLSVGTAWSRLGNHYYFWGSRDSPSKLSTTLDRRGLNPHPDLCNAAKVPGVPTWVIKGRQYSGVHNHCVAAGDSFANSVFATLPQLTS
ncbi:hypothetical protein [Nostoc sp.]